MENRFILNPGVQVEFCIEDLLHVNVNFKFLTLSEMKEKYNFEFPCTTYYSLLRAIPTERKSALQVKAGVLDESENCETSLKLFSTKKPILPYLIKASQHPQLKAEFYIMGSPKRKFCTSTCSLSKS